MTPEEEREAFAFILAVVMNGKENSVETVAKWIAAIRKDATQKERTKWTMIAAKN